MSQHNWRRKKTRKLVHNRNLKKERKKERKKGRKEVRKEGRKEERKKKRKKERNKERKPKGSGVLRLKSFKNLSIKNSIQNKYIFNFERYFQQKDPKYLLANDIK